MYSTNHNGILHMSRQYKCHDMCKILLWLVKNFWNYSTQNFYWILYLIEIPLVGQVPGVIKHHCCEKTNPPITKKPVGCWPSSGGISQTYVTFKMSVIHLYVVCMAITDGAHCHHHSSLSSFFITIIHHHHHHQHHHHHLFYYHHHHYLSALLLFFQIGL